jgi:pheromone shutdown protein TraB
VLTSNDSITKEDVEKCKEKDLLENLLEEMAGDFPALSRVFVNERDVYLAHSLQVCLMENCKIKFGNQLI